jgi:hypothetical protein
MVNIPENAANHIPYSRGSSIEIPKYLPYSDLKVISKLQRMKYSI